VDHHQPDSGSKTSKSERDLGLSLGFYAGGASRLSATQLNGGTVGVVQTTRGRGSAGEPGEPYH